MADLWQKISSPPSAGLMKPKPRWSRHAATVPESLPAGAAAAAGAASAFAAGASVSSRERERERDLSLSACIGRYRSLVQVQVR